MDLRTQLGPERQWKEGLKFRYSRDVKMWGYLRHHMAAYFHANEMNTDEQCFEMTNRSNITLPRFNYENTQNIQGYYSDEWLDLNLTKCCLADMQLTCINDFLNLPSEIQSQKDQKESWF